MDELAADWFFDYLAGGQLESPYFAQRLLPDLLGRLDVPRHTERAGYDHARLLAVNWIARQAFSRNSNVLIDRHLAAVTSFKNHTIQLSNIRWFKGLIEDIIGLELLQSHSLTDLEEKIFDHHESIHSKEQALLRLQLKDMELMTTIYEEELKQMELLVRIAKIFIEEGPVHSAEMTRYVSLINYNLKLKLDILRVEMRELTYPTEVASKLQTFREKFETEADELDKSVELMRRDYEAFMALGDQATVWASKYQRLQDQIELTRDDLKRLNQRLQRL